MCRADHPVIIPEEAPVDDTMFTLVPIIIAVIGLLVVGGIAIAVVKGLGQWSRNNASPVETVPATVTGKRTSVSGGGESSASTWYHATFELPTRERRELQVRSADFAQLAEGDRGQLTFQGTRFKGFQRDGAPPQAR